MLDINIATKQKFLFSICKLYLSSYFYFKVTYIFTFKIWLVYFVLLNVLWAS